MAILRDQPYGNARFLVHIDGLATQAFAEVHLPEFADDAVEYQEGGDAEAPPRKVPGRPRFGSLVLRRGFRGSLDLYQWWRQATSGDPGGRRALRVQLLDEGAVNVVAEWVVDGAWPVRYAVAPLVAAGGEVLMEQAELACESVEIR
jgi:phage tail-like protein